ncbi:MAG: hypothetical protein ABL997_04275 [Planctomycetota bacterium]
MRRGIPTFVFLQLLLGFMPVASAVGQTNAPAQPETLHIEIVGASVSAGFVDGPLTGGSTDNSSVPLLPILRGWFEDQDAKVQSRADPLMFLGSSKSGTLQIERAIRQTPQLLVAVDFLFWFAYGDLTVTNLKDAPARLQRLQEGLDLLDRVPGSILISDLPDMRGADRRMLRPAQIPEPESLVKLNEAIAAWAKERPRVRVFPLASTVSGMKDRGVVLHCGDRELTTEPMALLQKDRLHATRLGMAYLAHSLQPMIRELLPEAAREAVKERTFVEFCALADAEVDLADLQGRAKATPTEKGTEKSKDAEVPGADK